MANTVNWYATMLNNPKEDLKYDLSSNAISTNDPKSDCIAHIYPRRMPLQPPAAFDAASLFPFDQVIFGADPKRGWAAKGLVYAPARCRRNATAGLSAAQCALHMHLHDCDTRAVPSLPPPIQ